MKGILLNNNELLAEGKTYPISKNAQIPTNKSVGDKVEVFLGYEYPKSCDENPFCEGDEACIECYYNNMVAFIKS